MLAWVAFVSVDFMKHCHSDSRIGFVASVGELVVPQIKCVITLMLHNYITEKKFILFRNVLLVVWNI